MSRSSDTVGSPASIFAMRDWLECTAFASAAWLTLWRSLLCLRPPAKRKLARRRGYIVDSWDLDVASSYLHILPNGVVERTADLAKNFEFTAGAVCDSRFSNVYRDLLDDPRRMPRRPKDQQHVYVPCDPVSFRIGADPGDSPSPAPTP